MQNGSRKSGCPPEVLKAIYGANPDDKKKEYENSLKRWWTEYADRKNDEEDEYVANSLLYDRNHLPRTAPAPWNAPATTEPEHRHEAAAAVITEQPQPTQ